MCCVANLLELLLAAHFLSQSPEVNFGSHPIETVLLDLQSQEVLQAGLRKWRFPQKILCSVIARLISKYTLWSEWCRDSGVVNKWCLHSEQCCDTISDTLSIYLFDIPFTVLSFFFLNFVRLDHNCYQHFLLGEKPDYYMVTFFLVDSMKIDDR